MKHKKHEELKKVLLEWFKQALSLNYPVNGGNIAQKKPRKKRHILTSLSSVVRLGGWIDFGVDMVLCIDKFQVKMDMSLLTILLHVNIMCCLHYYASMPLKMCTC